MANKKKSIKGTQTERNLVIAYLAESSAYTRYMFYAAQADKENYFPIGQIFRETADNEMRHGKVFFKFLEGGSVKVDLSVDAGVIGDTASNLETAAHEEEVEGVELYMASAKVADEEGFPEIAEHFREIAEIEDHHRRRFEHYLMEPYGSGIRVSNGNVWFADMYMKELSPLKFVPHVIIPANITWGWITNCNPYNAILL